MTGWGKLFWDIPRYVTHCWSMSNTGNTLPVLHVHRGCHCCQPDHSTSLQVTGSRHSSSQCLMSLYAMLTRLRGSGDPFSPLPSNCQTTPTTKVLETTRVLLLLNCSQFLFLFLISWWTNYFSPPIPSSTMCMGAITKINVQYRNLYITKWKNFPSQIGSSREPWHQFAAPLLLSYLFGPCLFNAHTVCHPAWIYATQVYLHKRKTHFLYTAFILPIK